MSGQAYFFLTREVQNLHHAVALHFMHYIFCRIYQTLRVTPAMQAGLTDHVWTLDEIAQMAVVHTSAQKATDAVLLG